MPRYPLLMSDQTYVKLLQIGALKGASMGKLLNEILNHYVSDYEKGGAPKAEVSEISLCHFCKNPSELVIVNPLGNDYKVCKLHAEECLATGKWKHKLV